MEFLDAFDRSMPEYDRLSGNVAALVRDAAIQNSIDVLSNDGDDQSRTVSLTFALRVGFPADRGRIGNAINAGC
jgi:hypothetical protein